MAIHLAEVERSSQIKSYLKPNEVSESSKITADKLEGPLKGKQVSDLAFAGANGSLYMNIHTVENPNGEICGTASVPP